jgi:serine/threonine protein kinase
LGDHPNIATILDRWDEGGTAVMVTRFLPGGSLLELIARANETGDSLPVDDILKYSEAIASALSHIHDRRIVYRDLQPRNVLFDAWGVVHLVDFDTAIAVADRGLSDLPHCVVTDYSAPELASGGIGDECSDLYSLGMTIYEMCEGRTPFSGMRDENQTTRLEEALLAPARKDIPEQLSELVASLIAYEPERRPSAASEVAERLASLRVRRADIERYLATDESATLEFKSSLRTPIGPPRPEDKRTPKELSRILEGEIIETIAAFHNTDGGTLIVGVADDRHVIGIEIDYPSTQGTRDGWRLTFDNLVSRDLGIDAMNNIDLQLEPLHDHTIAVIRCTAREEPTWVGDDLFVRRAASTMKLSTRQALAWSWQKWG